MRTRTPSRRRLLVVYLVSSVLAMFVVMAIALYASRAAGADEAVEDARAKTTLLAEVVKGELPGGLLTGDAASIAAVDAVVRDSVLGPDVARVKVWTRDGTIVYSDEPRLIGTQYSLGSEEVEVLDDGGVEADISDLHKPENRYESTVGGMLEVYLPVRTNDGTPVLFEVYYRYDSVLESASRIWREFAPIILGGLLLLTLVNLPLAWWLARRVERDHVEKEELLQAAVDSSALERHRIAADLHDGVVQDLTGVSYSLAGAASSLERAGSDQAVAVADAGEHTRTAVSALRSLLIEIYPPNLRGAGLANALDGLLASVRSRGIATSLEVDPAARPGDDGEALLYRAAQEGLRNVVTHAEASRVDVRVQQEAGHVVLTVVDDGRGLGDSDWRSPAPGHAGLRLLADLVDRNGGTFELESGAAGGAVLRVSIPEGDAS